MSRTCKVCTSVTREGLGQIGAAIGAATAQRRRARRDAPAAAAEERRLSFDINEWSLMPQAAKAELLRGGATVLVRDGDLTYELSADDLANEEPRAQPEQAPPADLPPPSSILTRTDAADPWARAVANERFFNGVRHDGLLQMPPHEARALVAEECERGARAVARYEAAIASEARLDGIMGRGHEFAAAAAAEDLRESRRLQGTPFEGSAHDPVRARRDAMGDQAAWDRALAAERLFNGQGVR